MFYHKQELYLENSLIQAYTGCVNPEIIVERLMKKINGIKLIFAALPVFDNSLQKTSFRIGIKETENTSRYAVFKNISFVPGVDQGFKIESQDAQEK